MFKAILLTAVIFVFSSSAFAAEKGGGSGGGQGTSTSSSNGNQTQTGHHSDARLRPPRTFDDLSKTKGGPPNQPPSQRLANPKSQ
jgi:hypothetical protein